MTKQHQIHIRSESAENGGEWRKDGLKKRIRGVRYPSFFLVYLQVGRLNDLPFFFIILNRKYIAPIRRRKTYAHYYFGTNKKEGTITSQITSHFTKKDILWISQEWPTQQCLITLHATKLSLIIFQAIPFLRVTCGKEIVMLIPVFLPQIAILYVLLIQYFLKALQKMNYYTLLPNTYSNLPKNFMGNAPAVRNNTALILNILAEGLRISVGNYAIAAEQGKERRNVPAQRTEEKKEEKVRIAVVSKVREDQVKNGAIQKKKEKGVVMDKVERRVQLSEKPKENPVQNVTNDQESRLEDDAPPANKRLDSYNKLKKDKNRNKKDTRSVSVPTVSLLSTSNLPPLGLIQLQLKKKRQSLMRRQVYAWHQKMKNRRDKREIRMLSC